MLRACTPDPRTRGRASADLADAVTSFGGSWLFIGTFVGSSAGWVIWNSASPVPGRPDPYPQFLFLNMLLTVISTFQQPFVLLSQNRQNEEDRQRDEEDRAQLRWSSTPRTSNTSATFALHHRRTAWRVSHQQVDDVDAANDQTGVERVSSIQSSA